ncbi:MAG TPA: amidase [Candidatus Binatia bacterium]|nr:amidase [Candidatus Binatia bacterium]
MSDLSTRSVRAFANALRLPMAPGDLDEVTHRLNAFVAAMAPVGALPLDAVEPVPLPAAVEAPAASGGEGEGAPTSPARPAGAGDDLAFRPATELAALVRAGQLSPVALLDTYLARIDHLDADLRAYITVCRAEARRDAEEAERAIASGAPLGPLHGVPFAVKDQFDTAGVRTTGGSRLLADRVPEVDAPVVARLRAAGAVLVGKLNLTEFALGGTIAFPFGQPRNPWDRERDPGGSSAGSGIAAAAALCGFTLGEDTGGSIRGPAAWCGVVGLRPTWGLVPRTGCIPLCWSMDTGGPIARSVEDAAVVTALIAGPDPGDRFAGGPGRGLLWRPRPDLRGLRAGMIRELTESCDPEVRSAVRAAAAVLRGLGAVVDEVSLPLLAMAGAVFMALADSEGAGLHQAWLRTRGAEYDAGTRRRLLTASLLPAAIYHEATRARELIRQEVLGALAFRDLLLSPSQPTPAPPIAETREPVSSAADAATRFFGRRSYTAPYSLAGLPAISVPCGFSIEGLPIGLQIAGRAFDDATVLRAAHAYEQATPWRERRPPI